MTPSLEVINTSVDTHDDLSDAAPPSPTASDATHPTDQEDNDQHITRPGEHDVLLGRGGGTNNHSGNVKFRKLVNEHKMRYLACSKVDKPRVAREVVQLWRKMDPPGRFLARQDATRKGPGSVKAADNIWYEVGDKKAREKASQCLRERTPDVMPYIKQLREQQDAMTEHGVSLVQAQMHGMQGQQGMDMNGQPFPRRNSMPVPPPSQAPHPMQQQQQQEQQMMMHHRRASTGGQAQGQPWPADYNNGGMGMEPGMAPMSTNAMGMMGSDEAAFADMTDLEYEHLMRMQQQQLQMQHVALQRLRQQRMGLRRQGSGGNMAPPNMQGSGNMMPNMNGGNMMQQPMRSPNGYQMNNNMMQQQPHQDHSSSQHEDEPLPIQHADPVFDAGASSSSNKNNNKRSRATPDEAPSSPNAVHNANETGELTLEDYRQQLEEYMMRHPDEAAAHDDDGAASDLEDDWEKERERNQRQQAQQQEPKRGVGRGESYMSTMTDKSGFSKLGNMSLVSGMSMFSDISMLDKPCREQKMNMTRSVGSNLSLMSDMTDLSQNIDNLSLLDD